MGVPITPLDAWIRQKMGMQNQFTRQDLDAYQLEKLRETLDLARSKSPFYKHYLDKTPKTISCLEEIRSLPFTTPGDIREHGLGFLCVSQDEIQRVVTLYTSGTTGQPKRIYFTKDDQELTIDFFHQGMSTFTEPGDQVLILLPCEREGSVGDLLATGLQRLGAVPIKYGVIRDYAEVRQTILDNNGVEVLVGIPSQVFGLAHRSSDLSVKSVLLSTDHVPEVIARTLRETWKCDVFNHYGTTEMGLGGGVECRVHRGYHLREADMLFEIVDPETGEPVADGEMGEVVFTTLTRGGMPLIRYRTGDLSRFLPGRCDCGTVLKRMEQVRSRIDGLIPLGESRNLCMADLEDVLYAVEGVDKFSASMIRSENGNLLELLIGSLPGDHKLTEERIIEALDRIEVIQKAKSAQDLQIKVIISEKDSVPPHPGKRMIREARRPCIE